MSYLPRRSARAAGFARRYGSNTAAMLGDVSYHHASKRASTAKIILSELTVAALASKLPSRECLGSLSEAYSSCLKPLVTKTSILIKKEITSMLQNRRYEAVLDLLIRWVTSNQAKAWTEIVSEREMAFFMRQIVDHQIAVVNQAADSKITQRDTSQTRARFAEARNIREKIRAFYSCLLYGNPNESIYGRLKRLDVYQSSLATGYILSPADYVNLIALELGNQKLDLATKWFQRFDIQNGNLPSRYTHDLWLLYFKVYCGGAPFLWTAATTDVGTGDLIRRRGKVSSEKPWLEVFGEYLRALRLAEGSRPVLGNAMNQVLISCMGYSGSLDYLSSYIESIWGITARGKAKFVLEKSNSRYPDLGILRAIAVSFFHNGQFFQAMGYMNSFQDIYGLDLTHVSAKGLWDLVFRYGELMTRYDEDKALTYFLQQSKITVDQKKTKEDKLRQVQSNANFDYEGYLTFLRELEQKRQKTMSELWTLYQSANGIFSTRVVRAYMRFLDSSTASVEQYYDLMTFLASRHHQYTVSSQSFNRLHLTANRVNDTAGSVYALYGQALRQTMEMKGVLGYLGQIEPLIEEWSLDKAMAHNMRAIFKENLLRYRALLEERRLQKVEEETQDEEKFLDLF